MTGEELNNYLNPHRRAKGATLVNWARASNEYKAAMDSAAPGLELSQNGQAAPAPAAPAASVAPVVPATPSTPGVDSKMSVFVCNLKQDEAQTLYELLHTVRGCRIYKH